MLLLRFTTEERAGSEVSEMQDNVQVVQQSYKSKL